VSPEQKSRLETLAGADLRTWSESQQDGRWITTAALTLGLVESAI
jgi:hypothetical protein